MMTRVLHSLGVKLQEQLTCAQDLDEIRLLLEQYARTVKDRCLLRDRATTIRKAILELLEVAMDYRIAWDRLSVASPTRIRAAVLESETEFRRIEARFSKSCDFLMTLLRSALRQNIYPHLRMLYETLKGVGAYSPIWNLVRDR
jgi:hypothetical protein